MKPAYLRLCVVAAMASLCVSVAAEENSPPSDDGQIEKIQIWGATTQSAASESVNPNSIITQQDIQAINLATTEDVVKYEPSLVIRRRFIGDSNGTLGIRGANMFQTSRSMVFADGVPLHYLLQSRWNGAPRWTLVSASEIAQVEVLYGPFSAEYSGNAMGGVVVIETAIPQQREFHFDSSVFSQDFSAYGFNDRVNGYKTFVSYGDKIGDASVYFSYNRLDNQSQPQSFYYAANSNATDATAVHGGIKGSDVYGQSQLYFGDSGSIDTLTDNLKFKLGYDWQNWSALLNLAYENRQSDQLSPNSYLRDANGQPVWGGNVVLEGKTYSIPAKRLNVSTQQRDSLSAGLRVRGELNDNLVLEANLSQFAILDDDNRASASNPHFSGYTPAGQLTEYDDTGWQTADVKLTVNQLGSDKLQLVSGLRSEHYELNQNIYNSSDYANGVKDSYAGRNGGETQLLAAFSQLHWYIDDNWDLVLGGRYEQFSSFGGYYSADDKNTPEFDLTQVPHSSDNQFSPKFSIGYQGQDNWLWRYSFAKAYRFPIVEELFAQYQAYNAISQANPDLQPEDGTHHNLLLEQGLDKGYLRLNLFYENVDNVIEAQSTILPGGVSLNTFIPVDRVRTRGAEFIVNQHEIFDSQWDIRFNLAWTDSVISRNQANPELEGNLYPRMPKWRTNLLALYHLSEAWDISVNWQQATSSYGRLDNTDSAQHVYGAQDGYSRFGLKTAYQVTPQLQLSLGVDNITNQISYVAHPWPGRSWYFNLAYDL